MAGFEGVGEGAGAGAAADRGLSHHGGVEIGTDIIDVVVQEVAELEAEMALVIGTYECEWKKAVEDPATRARFRHFVNSEALDANIVLVDERGQRRPAKPGERGRIKETA